MYFILVVFVFENIILLTPYFGGMCIFHSIIGSFRISCLAMVEFGIAEIQDTNHLYDDRLKTTCPSIIGMGEKIIDHIK